MPEQLIETADNQMTISVPLTIYPVPKVATTARTGLPENRPGISLVGTVKFLTYIHHSRQTHLR